MKLNVLDELMDDFKAVVRTDKGQETISIKALSIKDAFSRAEKYGDVILVIEEGLK